MLESYQRISQAVGVSINLLTDGNTLISACGVIIKDNKLDFDKKLTDLNSIDDLKKQFTNKSHIALNLFGKGVLQKQIDSVENIDQNNFSQILPNANFDDFYTQNFISGEKSYISVIRKTEASKWLSILKQQGFTTLIFSLGPFPVYNIVSQLNVYDNELVFDGHIIARNEDAAWLGYSYTPSTLAPFPLKVESENIDEKLVIAYANAFQLVLAARLDLIKTDVLSVDTDFQNAIVALKLKIKGFIILSIFFMLLLINFFLFSWLNSSNAELTDRVSRSAQSTSSMQDITKDVQSKETLLKELGWDGGVKKSVLIDQLAALLPPELSWREIAINPIDQSTGRIQKALLFMDGKIRVVGNSEKIIPVNEWIARIKTYKWVKNIQLDSYTYNTELNTGQFIIIIDY